MKSETGILDMTKREGLFTGLDCYRGHLSDETQCLLEGANHNGFPLQVTGHGEGWFVTVPETPEYPAGIPVDLRRIFDIARESGCRYVRFDTYGQRQADLPKQGVYAA